MMHSVELYRRLGDESEFDPGWVECGGIRLASSEERMEELRRQAGWAKTFGLPLELISAEEAKELFPLMSTDGVLGAAWLPTDGYIDPSQLTYALADGARRGRLPDLHLDPGDRDRRPRRPGARRADRPRRDRGRGRRQRRRHVRGGDRPDGRRAGAGDPDVAPVPGHPAVPRARARGACRPCATPTCLIYYREDGGGLVDGRLRAPERAGVPARRDRRPRPRSRPTSTAACSRTTGTASRRSPRTRSGGCRRWTRSRSPS